jgi:hypothetical protein
LVNTIIAFEYLFLGVWLSNFYTFFLHASLTDEESRKNWEEFGNPDGPQGVVNIKVLYIMKILTIESEEY